MRRKLAKEEPPKKKRGPGRPRKSIEMHILEGTLEPSRHRHRDDAPDWLKQQKSAPPKTKKSVTKKKKPGEYVAKANQYIDDVLAGVIPVGALVKAACKRQKDDLVRLKKHPIYHWAPEYGERVCQFIERLPHIKGDKAKTNETIELEPWQCFILTTTFGWRRRDTKARRFKRAYIEVPRGNGKSAISSGVGLYCLADDEEPGAEVYSAATNREQARVVWDSAKAMMEKAPAVREEMGITLTQYSIVQRESFSKFQALSREANNQDGLNVHCGIIDELHAHKVRDTYDVIETGAGKRSNSLIWVITTAGSDTSGICYEVRSYVEKVLRGLEDDAQFGIIYTMDEGDDWTSPTTWQKVNPNWNVSVVPDVIQTLAFKAMQTPSAQNNFKTKHLNVWVGANEAAFDLSAWDKCADLMLKAKDFTGQDCFVGVDLASKVDIAARARIFPKMIEGKMHYYLFVNCYLPQAALSDGRNSQYAGWEIEGWLETTPGDVLDFATVKDDVMQDSRDFKVREVAYDPWQATQMAQELTDQGITMVEVRPSVQNFSAPMKELDALMRDGRLHHNCSPVLRWMISNTVGYYDAKDNIYPRKEKPENKIDGVIATLMALNRAMLSSPQETKEIRIRFL